MPWSIIPARHHMGNIETPASSKYPGISSVMGKAVGDWPVVVLGIAGLCTVAWASFLIWLMTYLVRLAFA